VIGAPGCARSARENGFDWVLARIFAELPVGAREIMGMGVGGLLMEIISRPQPRAGEGEEPMGQEIAALVLAAGRSTRFGSENKLLALLNGKPLVAHVVQAAQDAGLAPLVVTGHEAEMVGAVLPGLRSVHNPSYAEGMASSLRAGVAALPETVGAALVMLGDMPKVKASTLEALKAAAKTPGIKAVVPAFAGRRGNPVLLTRALFPSVMALHGDAGARKLLESAGDAVLVLEVDDPGVLADFDTPQALAQITQ
ncbi:MAG: NTP transferase domain-containing protein, partial [Proteobacteria bacterium]|nr:NTP transferase domain-containing protein [Pseudomonadota bacterium]